MAVGILAKQTLMHAYHVACQECVQSSNCLNTYCWIDMQSAYASVRSPCFMLPCHMPLSAGCRVPLFDVSAHPCPAPYTASDHLQYCTPGPVVLPLVLSITCSSATPLVPPAISPAHTGKQQQTSLPFAFMCMNDYRLSLSACCLRTSLW